MKKHWFLTVLAVLLVLAPASNGQSQSLEINPNVDLSKVDLLGWFTTIRPEYLEISEPSKESLEINVPVWFVDNKPWPVQGCQGVMLFDYPESISNFSAGTYRILTGGLASFYSPCSLPLEKLPTETWEQHTERVSQYISFNGSLSEAKTNVLYRNLAKKSQNFQPSTEIWMQDISSNYPARLGNFSLNGNLDSGMFELLVNKTGGDFKMIDRIRNSDPNKALNRQVLAAELDKVAEKINGVLPSTFLNSSRSNQGLEVDGTVFAISATANVEGWIGHTPVADQRPTPQGLPFWGDIGIAPAYFKRPGKDGSDVEFLRGWMRWTVRDVSENVMASGNHEIIPGFIAFTPVIEDTSSWPEGAYRVDACILDNNGSCKPDIELNDSTFFIVYRKSWTRSKMFVIANGFQFSEFNPFLEPNDIVDLGGGFSIETYPGLLVINGATGDVTISDGGETRIFTPDSDLSTIYLWTRRSQPVIKAVTNAATFQQNGKVSPGSIVTLFTWGATHGDPESASSLPLSKSGCGEQTTVWFMSADRQVVESAPVFYCSQNQLNVQVPKSMSTGKIKIWTDLGVGLSNEVVVDSVPADPGIFVLDWANLSGAIIFATGPKAGQVAGTRGNPVRPGDILSVYATGLGEVDGQSPSDGEPANGLYRTLLPVSVKTASLNIEPLFSGLAPGFVGLYQINFQVPANIGTGTLPLAILAGTQVSNSVVLNVVD